MKLLGYVALADHSTSNCFVLCVLGYGRIDGIFGTNFPKEKDDIITIADIEEKVQNCQTLERKPKFFVYDIWLKDQEDGRLRFRNFALRGRDRRVRHQNYAVFENAGEVIEDGFRIEVNVPQFSQRSSGECYYVEALVLCEMQSYDMSLVSLLQTRCDEHQIQTQKRPHVWCPSLMNLRRISTENIL